MEGIQSLFRGPELQLGPTLSTQYELKNKDLKHLYALLDNGEYTRVQYVDLDGSVQEFAVPIERILRISSKYFFVALGNNQQLLVDISSGDVREFQGAELDYQTIVFKGGFIFAITLDRRELRKIEPVSMTDTLIWKIEDHSRFNVGGIFRVSNADIMENKTYYTAGETANFESIVVDRDLNILVHTYPNTTPNFEYGFYAVMADGRKARISYDEFVKRTIIYGNDGGLYEVRSNSGEYVHLHPSSPAAAAFDYTLSELNFSLAGLAATEIQKIHPLASSTLNQDTIPLRCRSDYTIDSDKRYIVNAYGVLKIDASSSIPSIAFGITGVRFWSDSHPHALNLLDSCYISGDWVYYKNTGIDKIFRRNLSTPSSFEAEEIVSRSGIVSFFVVGDRLHYSTSSKSYRVKLNGIEDEEFSADPDFSIYDHIKVK